jgi:hypothetical protein
MLMSLSAATQAESDKSRINSMLRNRFIAIT